MSWLARAWILLVAVGVGVLAAGHRIGPEQMPLLALTQYLPYPAYVLPAGLACVLAVWLGWFWRALALGSLAVCTTVLMGLAWGTPDDGHGRVRVMTYNAKAFLAKQRTGGFAELAQEVNEQQPDILMMQDAGHLALEAEEGRPDAVRQVVGADRHVYQFGQYVVASRWPLRDCGPGAIPINGQGHSFVRCTVTIDGVTVHLVTVHLVTPRAGLNATRAEGLGGLDEWQGNMMNRLHQAGTLAEHLRQLPDGPVILGGDLNAPESSLVVKTLLNTGLRDVWSSAGRGYGYTHGHSLLKGLSFLRIDHILVSDEIGVAAVSVGGAAASEHRPVIADLMLHRQ